MNRLVVRRHAATAALIAGLAIILGAFQPGIASASSADISVSPSSQTLAVSAIFTVTVTQNADVPTTAIQTNVSFNPTTLQVLNVATAGAYSSAGLILGVGGQTLSQAIAEANQDGSLKNVAAYTQPGSSTVPAGLTDALVITMKAYGAATSPITLSSYLMTDASWELMPSLTPHDGSVTVTGSAFSGSTADGDGDGVIDGCDSCPSWPNLSQALPNWSVPIGDADCDGFPGSVAASGKAPESFIGSDATKQCASTSTANDEAAPDVWPVDFNDDQAVNQLDLDLFAGVFNTDAPGPPYNVRFDLNGNGVINGQDTGKLSAYWNKTCVVSGP